MEINPAFVNAYIWAAIAFVELAYVQMEREENPVAATDEAIQMHQKTLALDPQNAYSHNGLGTCYLIKARVLLKQGKDPTPELQSARKSFQEGLSLNNKILTTYMGMAEVELQAASNAVNLKQSPEIFLNEADRILREGLTLSPDSYQCLQSLAFVYLMRAEHLHSLRQSGETEIRMGIEACDHSLKGNLENPFVHAYRGKLFLLRARSLSGASRLKAAKEAVASFDHAFLLGNFLRKEYGNDREEANQLAQ